MACNGILREFKMRLANNQILFPKRQTIAYLKLIQHASKNDYNPQKANAAHEEIRRWFLYYCPQCPINEIPSYWELYSIVDEIRKLRPAVKDEVFDSHITPQKVWLQIDTETSKVPALKHNPTHLDTFFLQLQSGNIPIPNTIDFWYNASIASERDKQRLLGWFWKYCPQCEPENEPPLRLLIFQIHKAKSLLGAKAKPELEMEDSIPIFHRFSMFIKQGRIPLSTLPSWYYPRPREAKDLTWQQAAELLLWCQKYTPNLSLTETPVCRKDLGEAIGSGIEHVVTALERINQRLKTALYENAKLPIISDDKYHRDKSKEGLKDILHNTTNTNASSIRKEWHSQWSERIPFTDLNNIQTEKELYRTEGKYPEAFFNVRSAARKSYTKKRKPKSLVTTEDTCHSEACIWADVEESWKRIQSEQTSYYDGIEYPKFCFDDTELAKEDTEWAEIGWYGIVDCPGFDIRIQKEEVLDFAGGIVVIDEFAW
ncbi:hypothetical protein OCU04_005145 [Sclerotinia nivalis]|uniref:Uncharacterized protein n=1 Tax=Sclerotinia nivalis TaxID=352851 RepID=A0A9X0APG3_9HELO|nr:hypothetical protein OCU04_005145 [Sclerotinia nivalis]